MPSGNTGNTTTNSSSPNEKSTIVRNEGIRKLLAAVDRYSTEVTEALESEPLVAAKKEEEKSTTATNHSKDER